MQLSQEHFDEAIKKLATLDDVTTISDRLLSIEKILDTHTNILDGITKNTETWKAEAAALRSAVNRHEQWISKIAEKLGIKLET